MFLVGEGDSVLSQVLNKSLAEQRQHEEAKKGTLKRVEQARENPSGTSSSTDVVRLTFDLHGSHHPQLWSILALWCHRSTLSSKFYQIKQLATIFMYSILLNEQKSRWLMMKHPTLDSGRNIYILHVYIWISSFLVSPLGIKWCNVISCGIRRLVISGQLTSANTSESHMPSGHRWETSAPCARRVITGSLRALLSVEALAVTRGLQISLRVFLKRMSIL